jgi:sirohydrochlorin cobaltochelatase
VSTALLVVGHGSREARANRAFEDFVAGYRRHRGGERVAHAYLELAEPLADRALAELAREHRRVVVVPLFLFMVGHVKNDIPVALTRARAAFPGVDFLATRELGVHATLVELAWQRASAAAPLDASAALVIAGRGSNDPTANAEHYRLARLIGEGRGLGWLVPCFLGVTTPLLPAALDATGRCRPERIVVLPHLLIDGRLAERTRAQAAAFAACHPWIRVSVAEPLGPDPRLHAVLDERIDQALRGAAPLPCDTCQYRAPIAGIVREVDGVRALLWSLRHRYTHAQAAPHRHAHPALARHLLVCGDADCAERGSLALLDRLRGLIKSAGRRHDIRVTRTSCMGRCGEGPTLAVYPDGIWYRGVRDTDAEELVTQHLLGDRLVARLVDNIMQ